MSNNLLKKVNVKIDRHGKARVLTQQEIQRLFTEGLISDRDRTICAVMLYAGCRVNEAVTLKTSDVYDKKGRIRPELILRKGNTKGKLATRTILILDDLRYFLEKYKPPVTSAGRLKFFPNAGIPLRVIQEISGHRNLEQLQRYLEVEMSQVRGAIATLSIRFQTIAF